MPLPTVMSVWFCSPIVSSERAGIAWCFCITSFQQGSRPELIMCQVVVKPTQSHWRRFLGQDKSSKNSRQWKERLRIVCGGERRQVSVETTSSSCGSSSSWQERTVRLNIEELPQIHAAERTSYIQQLTLRPVISLFNRSDWPPHQIPDPRAISKTRPNASTQLAPPSSAPTRRPLSSAWP